MNKFIRPFIYVVVGLAILGIGFKLITQTQAFFTDLLITVGFVALFGAIAYFIFFKRRGMGGGGSNEMKRYRQAVKQSKQKYASNSSPSLTSKMKPSNIKKSSVKGTKAKAKAKPKAKRASSSHLRVIEGNKDKKKDRASS
ncbi:membrane protein [Pontibacillus halophilus JSM 076056 = DSM 19796]|uniref:Membrane protein n=1 Tax=Pontibacillus halophilus JSM 076056 = DSM 19796 TaxID=1385510 RepID=A0A0A5GI51_9BACI|nr:SA1362 family protein [Pontibacillus halophilus]KGX90893.1 membrane protein [Pontibacillus halophilus JSM 076056 = DSM 19796]